MIYLVYFQCVMSHKTPLHDYLDAIEFCVYVFMVISRSGRNIYIFCLLLDLDHTLLVIEEI
jgi:hypothetical protein